jgi:hypothetical protein
MAQQLNKYPGQAKIQIDTLKEEIETNLADKPLMVNMGMDKGTCAECTKQSRREIRSLYSSPESCNLRLQGVFRGPCWGPTAEED